MSRKPRLFSASSRPKWISRPSTISCAILVWTTGSFDRATRSIRIEILQRADLLKFRGYGMGAVLFADFPPDVAWHLARVTADELLGVPLHQSGRVGEGFGGFRLPLVAAQEIQAGRASHKPLASFAPRPGLSDALGLLIAVTDGRKPVLLEGHNRVHNPCAPPRSAARIRRALPRVQRANGRVVLVLARR